MIYESFEERVKDPMMWIYKGDELKYAADVLAEFELIHVRPNRKYHNGVYEHTFISVMPQVMMLYAYAIENYIKSLLVIRGQIDIINNKISGASHNLTLMLESIGVKVSGVYKELLEKYERHIFWEGRYPAPIKKDLLIEDCDSSNVSEWPNSYVIDHDINMMKSIINNIELIINDEIMKRK